MLSSFSLLSGDGPRTPVAPRLLTQVTYRARARLEGPC